jgi:excisionase family DNA binding protein
MSDRVLVPLPDGRWLALAPEVFREALEAGAVAACVPGSSDGDQASDDGEALLDAEHLAEALSLPVTWIEQAARERRIPSIQAGRWRRFKRSAVERELAKHV